MSLPGLSFSPGKEFLVENMAVMAEFSKLWFSLFFLVCFMPWSFFS